MWFLRWKIDARREVPLPGSALRAVHDDFEGVRGGGQITGQAVQGCSRMPLCFMVSTQIPEEQLLDRLYKIYFLGGMVHYTNQWRTQTLSLYEGTAGTACFLADVLNPDEAEFPFFDVFA